MDVPFKSFTKSPVTLLMSIHPIRGFLFFLAPAVIPSIISLSNDWCALIMCRKYYIFSIFVMASNDMFGLTLWKICLFSFLSTTFFEFSTIPIVQNIRFFLFFYEYADIVVEPSLTCGQQVQGSPPEILWCHLIVWRSLSTCSFQRSQGLPRGILPLEVLFTSWNTILVFSRRIMSEHTYPSTSRHGNDICIFISSALLNPPYVVLLNGARNIYQNFVFKCIECFNDLFHKIQFYEQCRKTVTW